MPSPARVQPAQRNQIADAAARRRRSVFSIGVTADEAGLLASYRAADGRRSRACSIARAAARQRASARARAIAAAAARRPPRRRRRVGLAAGRSSPPPRGRAGIAAKAVSRWMAARRHASCGALRRWALETDEAARSSRLHDIGARGVWRWMSVRRSARLQRAFRRWSVRASREQNVAGRATLKWTRALKQSARRERDTPRAPWLVERERAAVGDEAERSPPPPAPSPPPPPSLGRRPRARRGARAPRESLFVRAARDRADGSPAKPWALDAAAVARDSTRRSASRTQAERGPARPPFSPSSDAWLGETLGRSSATLAKSVEQWRATLRGVSGPELLARCVSGLSSSRAACRARRLARALGVAAARPPSQSALPSMLPRRPRASVPLRDLARSPAPSFLRPFLSFVGGGGGLGYRCVALPEQNAMVHMTRDAALWNPSKALKMGTAAAFLKCAPLSRRRPRARGHSRARPPPRG